MKSGESMKRIKKIFSLVVVIFSILTLVSCFEEKLSVQYNLGYDNKIANVLSIAKNENLTKPEDPLREGFVFIGWYKDNELYDFNDEVKENLILTAKWEKETFIVSFNGAESEDQIVKYQEKATKPINPVKEGFIFLGWYLNGNLYDFNNEVIKDIELKAKWELIEVENIFTITLWYDYDNLVNEVEILEGEIFNQPTIEQREGYIFLGWYKDDELYDFNEKVYEDFVLYAMWEEVSLEKISIGEFKTLENGEEDVISGIITSFSAYNYLTIEDETGAILVRVIGYDIPKLLELNYQEGNRLTFSATKINLRNSAIAQTTIDDIVKDEIINALPESIDITNITQEDLSQYDAHLISHDYLIITNIKEEINRLKFTLKNDNLIINAIYDIRYLFTGYEYLNSFEIYDIVKLENIPFVDDITPSVFIGSLEQIEKIGKADIVLDETLFKIHYLNDTHGSIFNNGNELGMSRIGNYIKNTKDENSIFITGGDMFQGELISNANNGAIFIEILNNLSLDAFVIGNHEFDWGLDVILKYFDPETTGVKADFPLLGANVKRKIDGKRPEFIDSHTIIKRGNYNIGIIGVIGFGLENSISRLRVEDYEFTKPYDAVRDTLNEIDDFVDFVLVVNHHSDSDFNDQVVNLPKVKAVFNGHTHREEAGFIKDSGIPFIQSASNGRMVGEIELLINKENGVTLKNSTVTNVKYHQHLNSEDLEINAIIESYYEELKYLYEDEIIKASRTMSQNDLAYFIAQLMAKSTGSIFGLQNSGGTRSNIFQGSITGSDVFKVFPFDNRIISVEILGKDLKMIYNRETYIYLDINFNAINDYEYYKIATNDYVFFNNYNKDVFEPFYEEATVYGDLYETFYGYLVDLKSQGHNYFDTNNPVTYQYSSMFIYEYYEKIDNQMVWQ